MNSPYPIKTRACLPSVCEVAEQHGKALVFQHCGRIRRSRQAGGKAHKKGRISVCLRGSRRDWRCGHMDCDFLAAQQEVLMDLSSAALICHVLMAKAGSAGNSELPQWFRTWGPVRQSDKPSKGRGPFVCMHLIFQHSLLPTKINQDFNKLLHCCGSKSKFWKNHFKLLCLAYVLLRHMPRPD